MAALDRIKAMLGTLADYREWQGCMGKPLTVILRPLGRHLRQTLIRRGMPQAKLAQRIGCHPSTIHSIIYRHQRISADMAKRFEDVLGISATTWLRLQEEGNTNDATQ